MESVISVPCNVRNKFNEALMMGGVGMRECCVQDAAAVNAAAADVVNDKNRDVHS